tara:strand:+ start:919 stop:1326 length:408 start_codon:yes stop_codon:yes gene_type:complete
MENGAHLVLLNKFSLLLYVIGASLFTVGLFYIYKSDSTADTEDLSAFLIDFGLVILFLPFIYFFIAVKDIRKYKILFSSVIVILSGIIAIFFTVGEKKTRLAGHTGDINSIGITSSCLLGVFFIILLVTRQNIFI